MAETPHSQFQPEAEATIGRQEIEPAQKSYFDYFQVGAEGGRLNPEGAKYSRDALLYLTSQIHTRAQGNHLDKTLQAEFLEKYPKSPLKEASRPGALIKAWLSRLGPLNGLSGAESDLTTGRQLLVDNIGVAGFQGEMEEHPLFDHVAEIDIELANLLQGDEGLPYLQEAVRHAEVALNREIKKGLLGKATLAQMKLGHLKIEGARHQAFGTRSLIDTNARDSYPAHNYALLESVVRQELIRLEAIIDTSLQDIIDDEALYDNEDTDIGLLLEAVAYHKVMTTLVTEHALAHSRIRPATYREESGKTQRYCTPHTSNRQKTGTNLNFDLVYTAIDPRTPSGLTHLYLQNKLSGLSTREGKISIANTALDPGKEFRYFYPSELTESIDEPNRSPMQNLTVQERATALQQQLHASKTALGQGDYNLDL